MAAPKSLSMGVRKKIMFLVQDRPNWTGGPIINVRRLLPAWKAAGYEVIAPTGYRDDAPNARFLEAQGIPCPLFKMPAATELYTAWILEQVAIHRPDVFVGDTHVAGGYALPWLNTWGIPSVMMVRNLDAYNLEVAHAFFGKNRTRHATALVCVNERIRQEILKNYPTTDAESVRVIPSGVPTSAYRAQWVKDGPLRLVYAGVLMEERKRLLKLWEAFVYAHTIDPNLHLTFIGDGPLRTTLEQKALEAGLKEKVSFTGVLLDDAYKAMLAQQQILLLFSDHEGTPGSVMDAMSCGLVPLCRNMEGIESIIQHERNGLIFDGSKENFVAQLQKLKVENTWQQYATQALEDFGARFSLDMALQRWDELLEYVYEKKLEPVEIKRPAKIKLPPVRFHFANADRRQNLLFALLRGIYILWQRATQRK
jgi:glycosyltransferase involved in cell wall biosynthesis